MRLRRKPWIKEAINEFTDILLPETGEFNWPAIFGQEKPLHIEVGTGKGKFIGEMAQANPAVNFVGLEAQLDVIYYAARKVKDGGLSNVRLMHFDANQLLAVFAPASVDRLYVNFCDPWPKNRHAKRRLTHSRFLDKYRVILRPGGELFFKTDNERLFEFSLNEFADARLRLRNISLDLHRDETFANVTTEYEERFKKQGLKIFRCEVIF